MLEREEEYHRRPGEVQNCERHRDTGADADIGHESDEAKYRPQQPAEWMRLDLLFCHREYVWRVAYRADNGREDAEDFINTHAESLTQMQGSRLTGAGTFPCACSAQGKVFRPPPRAKQLARFSPNIQKKRPILTDRSFLLNAQSTGVEPATSHVHGIPYFHSGMDYIFTISFRF